jgi:FkbM family methyltransferase
MTASDGTRGGGPLEMPPAARLQPLAGWNRYLGTPDPHDLEWMERHRRFAGLTAAAPMAWLFDLELIIRPEDQISQALFTSGVYEPCTAVALDQLLRPGGTFIDVGANVGLFTLIASRWVGPAGRVVSLEPSTREFQRLLAHVELNGLTNVLALQLAAGAAPGRAQLHVAEDRYPGLNTLAPAFMYSGVAEAGVETVTVATLDDVLSAHGIRGVTAIKIDVEGLEPEVVAGARRTIASDNPAIVIEVGGEALDPAHERRRGMERMLEEAGYEFAAIDGRTASIYRVDDLSHAAENLVAAPPATIGRLLEEYDRAKR